MDYKYYDKFINKKTIGRYDVTPIFSKPKVFSNLIDDLIKPFKNKKFNKIVGLDALGFIIGGAISNKLKVGFVPIRKGGMLPGIKSTLVNTSFVDYSNKKKTLEMSKQAIKRGDRVLIVDEWIETGTQIKSAIALIEKLGGKVIGISALCIEIRPETKTLIEKYNCQTIGIIRN